VLDASPEAEALGVRRGMALGSAHRLAPEAAFLDHHPAADEAAVEAALERLASFSPGVAGTTDVDDAAFGRLEVQVDGLERLWGLEPVLVERMAAALDRYADRSSAGEGGHPHPSPLPMGEGAIARDAGEAK